MDEDISKLFDLVREGDLQGLKDMVEQRKRDSLLNSLNGEGRTVLHIAAEHNHPSIIKWLLSSSEGGGRAAGFTNLLGRGQGGTTALHYAAWNGHLECCQALVEGSMMDNGERAELLNAVDDYEWTALHYALDEGRASIIRWLLSSSEGGGRAAGFTNILAKSRDGLTALHVAAEGGYLECCQALVEGSMIENGEREELLNTTDLQGWTVLHFAAFFNRQDIVQWLLSSEEGGGRVAGFTSASITMKASDYSSVLHLVARSGSVEALNALLSGCTPAERLTLFLSVDNHGWTPLHIAARYRKSDIIHELLLRHPETQTIVDARDHRGMTALHRAVIGGINEESKNEWQGDEEGAAANNIADATVIEALLTTPKKKDDDDQQAAMIDPNLGTKVE